MASLSTTSTPADSANRLARPVKARSTRTPSPATAVAMSAAATSSGTSAGSRRGTPLLPASRPEPRHHDLGDARRRQRRDLGLADERALLEHRAILADRMDGD